jgi:hypothetical protein
LECEGRPPASKRDGAALLVAPRLDRVPALDVFVSNDGVELRSKRPGEAPDPNDFLDVGNVLQPMRSGQARRELQIEERMERQQGDTRAAFSGLGWIREHHGLGLAIAGIRAGKDNVDIDPVLRVADATAAWKLVNRAATEMVFLEFSVRLSGRVT